ncbi:MULTISPECIES: hypothetical protein [Tsukamurella]|uniref:Uncharacterized protein n=1 Tax=Tsukamurella columbiensis TaxID=128509 RepID=A0ABX1LEU1_9ACTN|nr:MULTISPECIES: hypothetical protein [Tsukamurella]NMD56801.1 hypothetical protein [Tsukamurella columbiensis]
MSQVAWFDGAAHPRRRPHPGGTGRLLMTGPVVAAVLFTVLAAASH